MTSTNCITGARLISKTSDAYRDAYDRIFQKKEPEVQLEKRKILLLNQAKCNCCGEVLTSKHRHDYVSCSCNNLHCDGGTSYAKRNFGEYGYTDMCVYTDEDDYNTIREYLSWRSYGINGDEPAKDILLKDLTTLHIQNILKTQLHIKGSYVELALQYELELRNSNA